MNKVHKNHHKPYVIVIPTYNEKDSVPKLLNLLDKQLTNRNDVSLLIADDNSPDGTKKIVEEIIKSSKFKIPIEIISKEKSGLKDAYFNAFRYLIKNNPSLKGVIQMDADLSHNPKFALKHLDNLKAGIDLSIGSRYVKGGGVSNWSKKRLLMSQIGNILNKIVLSFKIKDYTGGFNAFSLNALRYVLPEGFILSNGYYFQTELKYRLLKKGFSMNEFPIVFEERAIGVSKMSNAIVLESIKQLLSIRFKKVS